jgi:hypothetical protein
MLIVTPAELEVGHHIKDENGIVWVVAWIGYGPHHSEHCQSITLGLTREIMLVCECHNET